MAQASGSSAEIWYKIETTNGVTPSADSGADTTLASAVNPGATQITVTSATGIDVNDILKVGNDNNMEFVKVSSIASAPVIDLDSNTKINYRHGALEAVKETDPTADWFKLGNVRSFTPSGGRDLQRSQSLTGTRVLSNFREGNYDAGADMTVEMDIAATGLFYMHSLNSDYSSAGTTQASSPVNTTIAGAVVAGAATFDVQAGQGSTVSVWDFLLLGTGTNAELVKVGSIATDTITLDTAAHPNGLRKAHIDTDPVVEKIAPFTHSIVRGSTIPAGISFLLRFTDIESLMLIRGNKLSNLTLNVDPSDLPLLNMNVVGKAFQILSENIFGTPTTIAHTPYSHWEAVVKVDGSEQTSNQFENLSVVIENTIQGNFVVGSPIKGSITPGEGSVSGSFTYQYGSQQFAEKTVAGTETQLDFDWTYIGDNNHSVNIGIPKAKFEGNPHPGVSSKDPITDEKSFLGRLDPSSNTDISVSVKNNQPTIEYMVETVTP
jgi:tail tube protein